MSDRDATEREIVSAILKDQLPGYELASDEATRDLDMCSTPGAAVSPSIGELRKHYGRWAAPRRQAGRAAAPPSTVSDLRVFRVRPIGTMGNEVEPTTIVVSLEDKVIVGAPA